MSAIQAHFALLFFRSDSFSRPVFALAQTSAQAVLPALFFGENEKTMGIGEKINNWTNEINNNLR